MEDKKTLLKIAYTLQHSLEQSRRNRYVQVLERITTVARGLTGLSEQAQRLSICVSCCWYVAAESCRCRMSRQLTDLLHSLQQSVQFMQGPEPGVPQLSALIGELEQVEDELGPMHFEHSSGILSVETDPVTLEDVYLGPFQISLELNRLADLYDRSPYYCTALDPHPAAARSDLTHPHVSDERLCEGEGTAAISTALHQGRLFDFFSLVNGILNTYNPDSPYISLREWDGTACYSCGYVVDQDSRYFCEFCQNDFCDECSMPCYDCSESVCLRCSNVCSSCEERFCRNCISACSKCDAQCCNSCMEENLCPHCREEESDHETNNQQSDTEPDRAIPPAATGPVQIPKPADQPHSVGQASVLQGQDRQ